MVPRSFLVEQLANYAPPPPASVISRMYSVPLQEGARVRSEWAYVWADGHTKDMTDEEVVLELINRVRDEGYQSGLESERGERSRRRW